MCIAKCLLAVKATLSSFLFQKLGVECMKKSNIADFYTISNSVRHDQDQKD